MSSTQEFNLNEVYHPPAYPYNFEVPVQSKGSYQAPDFPINAQDYIPYYPVIPTAPQPLNFEASFNPAQQQVPPFGNFQHFVPDYPPVPTEYAQPLYYDPNLEQGYIPGQEFNPPLYQGILPPPVVEQQFVPPSLPAQFIAPSLPEGTTIEPKIAGVNIPLETLRTISSIGMNNEDSLKSKKETISDIVSSLKRIDIDIDNEKEKKLQRAFKTLLTQSIHFGLTIEDLAYLKQTSHVPRGYVLTGENTEGFKLSKDEFEAIKRIDNIPDLNDGEKYLNIAGILNPSSLIFESLHVDVNEKYNKAKEVLQSIRNREFNRDEKEKIEVVIDKPKTFFVKGVAIPYEGGDLSTLAIIKTVVESDDSKNTKCEEIQRRLGIE